MLTGANFESRDFGPQGFTGKTTTGAFSPFGTESHAGQRVPGRMPCSGAIFRIAPTGGPLELVAWGFRNPFGLAFAPDGVLYATDNGYDDRGSRPVFGSADVLWRVERNIWYGWPDFSEGRRVYGAEPFGDYYRAPDERTPPRLLAEHPNPPPRPAAFLPVHASATGFDFSRSPRFGHVGEAFIAQFGDQAPVVGKTFAPVGFKVVRVNLATGATADFAVNRSKENGPASKVGGGGLERPVAARFDPKGESLYVVDFGVMTMSDQGAHPKRQTGVLWRIRKTGTGR